jgi:hypothetical protein
VTEDAFTTPDTEPAEPAEAAPVEHVSTEEESTGHPQVDAVLASLSGLDGTPVEEHVGIFESAHDTLRGALADAGDPPPSQG